MTGASGATLDAGRALAAGSENRLLKALLLAGGPRTWIWGTGQAGRDALAWLRTVGVTPAGFLEGVATQPGRTIDGLPVLPAIDAAAARAPEALVIIASMHAGEIFARIAAEGVWRGTMIAFPDGSGHLAGLSAPSPAIDRDALSALVREAAEAAIQQWVGFAPAGQRQANYTRLAWLAAGMEAAAYMSERMQEAADFETAEALRAHAFSRSAGDGLILEFGVFDGGSLRQLASLTSQDVYGFDSFEGLPEDWTYFQKKGRFARNGEPPAIDAPNVHFRRGWFDQSLPVFLREHTSPLRFLHIDCDLYSSTRTVLDLLRDRIVPGTIIVFDEYLNYPGWRQHEYKAFQEVVQRTGLRYRYLGFASSEWAVAVEVL